MNGLLGAVETLSMAFRFFQNPLVVVPIATARSSDRWYVVALRCGPKMALRPSRNLPVPDISILHEILADDQYVLTQIIDGGDTVVDIGAHIGIFSVLAAARCGDGEVLAFEPEPSNYCLLQVNAALNPTLSIRTFNQAAFSSRSERPLHLSRTNSGAHTLLLDSGDSALVRCITLGDVLHLTEKGHIDLLKLDCEGSEFDIIASTSMDDLRKIDRIIMEVHDAAYTRPGDIDSLFDRLSTAGFSFDVLRSVTYPNEGHFRIVLALRDRSSMRPAGVTCKDGDD